MNADSALRVLVAKWRDLAEDMVTSDICSRTHAVRLRQCADELETILAAPQAAPAGMVLVPREPTWAIRNSIYMALHYDMSVMNPDEWGAVDKAYAAMIAAAPQPSDTTTPSGWKLNPSHDGGLIVSGPIGGCVVFADKGRIAERVLHSLATAMLAAAPAAQVAVSGWSAEDACEQFIAAEVDAAPEALRRLGDWLCNVLDEDLQKTASAMVLGAMMETSAAIRAVSAAPPSQDAEDAAKQAWHACYGAIIEQLAVLACLREPEQVTARLAGHWQHEMVDRERVMQVLTRIRASLDVASAAARAARGGGS